MSDRPGILRVCATPIGNLGDVTLRVLEALAEADIIEAEDTRVTRKLLARYDIHTPLEPYHAQNLAQRTGDVVRRIRKGGRVALVSDAGTPGISDPGAHLVDACLDAGLVVEVLPGPSAIIAALVASGLPTYAFYFGGFLPRKTGERLRALETLASLDATLIFYESPRRTVATLDAIADVMPGRRAAMARELTKLHEEVVRGRVEDLAREIAGRELKGEVVLLIGPPVEGGGEIDEGAIADALRERVRAGESTKDAVRATARQLGVSRNVVYAIAVRELGGARPS